MSAEKIPKVVTNFLSRYEREFDYYQEVARRSAEICERILKETGTRAIVSYRAKKPESLRRKLIARQAKKAYRRASEISRDIVDLSGVRIALYFPGDREDVCRVVEDRFVVLQPPKEFPDRPKSYPGNFRKRFDGYHATHLRVCISPSDLGGEHARFADAMVEIQVASVLMHAWAEVEHDLVYKPASGRLSDAEYRALDELNGLVLTGETALEGLQAAVMQRLGQRNRPFHNHYELASYLHMLVKARLGARSVEPQMGRADVLLRFLQVANLSGSDDVSRVLANLVDISPDKTIVEQTFALLLAEQPDLYPLYREFQEEEAWWTSLPPTIPTVNLIDPPPRAVTSSNATLKFTIRGNALAANGLSSVIVSVRGDTPEAPGVPGPLIPAGTGPGTVAQNRFDVTTEQTGFSVDVVLTKDAAKGIQNVCFSIEAVDNGPNPSSASESSWTAITWVA